MRVNMSLNPDPRGIMGFYGSILNKSGKCNDLSRKLDFSLRLALSI